MNAMDMIGRQKALADRIEHVLKGEGCNVLLAGGAPRDWSRGLAATDLDFYIKAEDEETSAKLVSGLLDIALIKKGDGKYETFLEDTKELLAVYEGDFHGETVQFMFLSTEPLVFVEEKFDLSICKVWYENGEIDMNWEARLSFREKLVVGEKGYNLHTDKLMERLGWGNFYWCDSWKRALDRMDRKKKRRPIGGDEVNLVDVNPANEIELPRGLGMI